MSLKRNKKKKTILNRRFKLIKLVIYSFGRTILRSIIGEDGGGDLSNSWEFWVESSWKLTSGGGGGGGSVSRGESINSSLNFEEIVS